jgi:hypothetical protein
MLVGPYFAFPFTELWRSGHVVISSLDPLAFDLVMFLNTALDCKQLGSTMKLYFLLLVVALAVVQAEIKKRHKIKCQRIKTGNDDMTRSPQLCERKCKIWTNKHPDEPCLAFNWRPNNEKFPYRLRRRCMLCKRIKKECAPKKGWWCGEM